jgi:hypothetical protein
MDDLQAKFDWLSRRRRVPKTVFSSGFCRVTAGDFCSPYPQIQGRKDIHAIRRDPRIRTTRMVERNRRCGAHGEIWSDAQAAGMLRSKELRHNPQRFWSKVF